MDIKTINGNSATVTYSYEGIPTDGLIPLYIGYTIKNSIIIQPHLEKDKGLLAHELTHVDQWYQYRCFSLRYKYCKNFRFKMETEAFANQLKVDGGRKFLDKYVGELVSGRYGINQTKEECLSSINKFYKESVYVA